MYVMFTEKGIDLSGYFVEWTMVYCAIPVLLLFFGFLKSLAMVREFYTKDISLAYNFITDPEYIWHDAKTNIPWGRKWTTRTDTKGGETEELFAVFALLTLGSFINAFIIIFKIIF